MLKEVFKIISFYDESRWDSVSNYNQINFYNKNLCVDTKLLTHWVCYITDRQMSFQRIWDIGGFVFSELIDNFKLKGDLEILNPNNNNSFIQKNSRDGYSFLSSSKVGNNSILKDSYNYSSIENVDFTSRYYPSDYFSILSTFSVLKEYNLSLTRFIVSQLRDHIDREDVVKRILFSLYLLSYFEIGQPKKESISNFDKNIEKISKRTQKVQSILNDKYLYEKEYLTFLKDTVFKQKRGMCSLRDFFKSPEFSSYFRESLFIEGISKEEINHLISLKSFQQFELPGDVWNNNSKFRNCILENSGYEKSKKSLNRILRDFYNKNKDYVDGCYPEQFDVTFDFVPRMCESDNCEICPIGLLKGNDKGKSYSKTCVNDTELYCSVSLINCNYKSNCVGDKCKLNEVIM